MAEVSANEELAPTENDSAPRWLSKSPRGGAERGIQIWNNHERMADGIQIGNDHERMAEVSANALVQETESSSIQIGVDLEEWLKLSFRSESIMKEWLKLNRKKNPEDKEENYDLDRK